MQFNNIGKDKRIKRLAKFIQNHAKDLARDYEALQSMDNLASFKNACILIAGDFYQLEQKGIKINYSNIEYAGAARDLFVDIIENQTIRVYTEFDTHPVFSQKRKGLPTINQYFRAVHDYFGHFHAGSDFSFSGEVLATISHATKAILQNCKPLALEFIEVLLCEVIAQGYIFETTHKFPEQKVITSDNFKTISDVIYRDIHKNIAHYAGLFGHRSFTWLPEGVKQKRRTALAKNPTTNCFKTFDGCYYITERIDGNITQILSKEYKTEFLAWQNIEKEPLAKIAKHA